MNILQTVARKPVIVSPGADGAAVSAPKAAPTTGMPLPALHVFYNHLGAGTMMSTVAVSEWLILLRRGEQAQEGCCGS